MKTTLKIQHEPNANLMALSVIDETSTRFINFPLEQLSQPQQESLSSQGYLLNAHYMCLQKKLCLEKKYSHQLIDEIIAIAVLSNSIKKLATDLSISVIRTGSPILGELLGIIGEKNDFILVDIDISDDQYILVEMNYLEAIQLVKVDPRAITRKLTSND